MFIAGRYLHLRLLTGEKHEENFKCRDGLGRLKDREVQEAGGSTLASSAGSHGVWQALRASQHQVAVDANYAGHQQENCAPNSIFHFERCESLHLFIILLCQKIQ